MIDRIVACLAHAGVVFVFGMGSAVALAQEAVPPPVGVPMSREGSGTSWLPDASPMYAVHADRSGWELMAHGNAFLQYLYDDGPRGRDQGGSINWIMGMARRPLAGGRLGVRVMMSLEPLTIPGCGYPDLLASGETCDGDGIVDEQHPHDLFMEVAAVYERRLSNTVGLQIYGGPVAEPALGPVAFPHRISAVANPLAPISHHWLDATHVTFGVVTAGVHGRLWKVEGSVFNGREPDENRYDFDLAALDSYAGRVWFLPTPRLALQVSAGHLTAAEPGHDGERVNVARFTTSATYHRPIGSGPGVWATTVAWGRNSEDGAATDFLLAETSVTLADRDTWFGRVDVGRKEAHDLAVLDIEEPLAVAKLQAGYVRHVSAGRFLQAGLGATVSASVVPARLAEAYGSRANLGAGLFLTIRPQGMSMSAADPHAGHQMPQ